MADEQGVDYAGYLGDVNIKIRDIEEKQRILQDRTLLIGDNLIDLKEKTQEQILEMKKELEILKQKTLRIISFIETISEEFSKFAKKDDLEILIKQAKMFQPLLSRRKE